MVNPWSLLPVAVMLGFIVGIWVTAVVFHFAVRAKQRAEHIEEENGSFAALRERFHDN